MLGVIGGSGFYTLNGKRKESIIKTPYGEVDIEISEILGKRVVFIPRHKRRHSVPPHKVNYRANIYALKMLGITNIIGIYATGIISSYKPGDVILIKDFIGLWTPATFFDDFSDEMKHTDFSEPYHKELQNLANTIAKKKGIVLRKGGVIATTYGPRFETRAEITALKRLGANLVSMTHSYEATLIGELGIPYVAFAVGTNYACGVKKGKLTSKEVIEHMEKAKKKLCMLIDGFIEIL